MEQQAADWSKSRLIASYICAVKEVANEAGGIEPGGPLDLWLQWAEHYAHRLNPLSKP